MLICDHAIREEETFKVSLIGIFEKVWAPVFPMAHSTLSVYVKVGDAYGDYNLVLELIRLEDMMVVGRGEAKASVVDRLEPVEWLFNLGWLVFERAGTYEFRLTANGRHLESKSFTVVQLAEALEG